MKNDAFDRVKLPKPPRKNTGTILFIIIGGAILAYAIGALAWEYYTYGQEMRQFEQEVVAGQQEDATPQQRQIAEGKDETEPPVDVLATYTVASDHPRAIYIDKLGVRARVLPMSLNPDTSIQAPINIFDAGWYTGGPKPGEPGAAIIDGHASGPSRQGLFAYAETMAEVMRVHGDGEEGMNMITCTGAWVPGEKTFDTRAVIFTRRVS